jgi:hypothetical protein
MDALLLSILSRVLLGVTRLCSLDKGIGILVILDFTLRKHRFQLTMDNDICITARRVGEMSIEGKIERVMWLEMSWCPSGDEIFCSRDGLDKKSFHTLSDIRVIDLEKTILESTTARGIDFVPEASHTVSKCLQSARIWWALSSKERLFR